MKNYRALFILLSLILFNFSAFSQAEIEAEVDEQIWRPFMKSWGEFDAKGYNALHTADIIRVGSRGIQIGDEYLGPTEKMFAQGKESGRKRKIEFSLEQRIYTGNTGYEVGYFRITGTRSDGSDMEFYAQFHVVLKKKNGEWKIAQDFDTMMVGGRQVTAEDFNRCTKVEY